MFPTFRTLFALASALALAACAPPTRSAPADETVGSASSALSIGGLFASGVDDKGALLKDGTVDGHYVLSSDDLALPGPKAYAVAAAAGWAANTLTSKWLSAQANAKGAAAKTYTYTTTFSLYGMDPATATVTGKWACDDTCVLLLNGKQVAKNEAASAWTSLAAFTIPVGAPFVVGLNTLAFQVLNTSGTTGLHVAPLTGTASGCSADDQCALGMYCNNVTATCVVKVANGKAIPTVAGHTPVLDGKCSIDAGAAVCAAGVCDTKDDLCGYANGDGPCSNANAPLVCRTGTCSVATTCMPAGGCNVDGDCAGGWCSVATHLCAAKVTNGQAMPKDAAHVTPTLDGTCTAEAAALVCKSGVCDPKDDKCGLALADGPCTVKNGSIVCRSGACSVVGTCLAVGTCNADGDCAAGTWCNQSTNACAPVVPNGAALPKDPSHAQPTLDGTCSVDAGKLVCESGVCDPKDDLCGLAAGDGPCTMANGPFLCRTGSCSLEGACLPLGGCNVDSDCGAGTYCDEASNVCIPKLANGAPIPNDPSHASPTLDGTCSAGVGKTVCVSGVCDPKDNLCGLAEGDGPCTQSESDFCRSGQCSHNGTCTVKGGCNIDVDCINKDWCKTSTHECQARLENGDPMPTEAAHPAPALDGKCSPEAAALVCLSGVCDPQDDKCGLADGDGPCTPADAATHCRSGQCTNNLCGAGCAKDADCAAPTPVCNAEAHECVECSAANATECKDSKPVCDAATSTCRGCDGDLGSSAKHACASPGAPLCSAGKCGKCATDVDCTGHASGPACDAATGACVAGCTEDSECKGVEWCDGSSGKPGVCKAQLANGEHLPASPANVVACSGDVALRVCRSGVCDPKDDTCGLATSDGPCAVDGDCREGTCDAATKTCALPKGTCSSDADCQGGFCKAGACAAKLGDGSACDSAAQCSSGTCQQNACGSPPSTDSGGGCAISGRGGHDDAPLTALVLALGLALAGRARRRRRMETP